MSRRTLFSLPHSVPPASRIAFRSFSLALAFAAFGSPSGFAQNNTPISNLPPAPGGLIPTPPTPNRANTPPVPPATVPAPNIPNPVPPFGANPIAPGAIPPAPIPPTPGVAASTENPIAIVIDGTPVASDPAPLLKAGAVYVPLRGVLENLGASVQYDAKDNRIDIKQGGKLTILRPGQPGAIVDVQAVEIPAPEVVNGRAFVPLRALAELFGYGVNWQNATRTVFISSASTAVIAADHRVALKTAGSLGVIIDFSRYTPADVPALLDAAKASGASMIQTRFDWATLEPTKGAPFQWAVYDAAVKGARERGLVVVGQFGDTAPWASASVTGGEGVQRRTPPRDEELPSWSNYVKRVVGRYKNDVQAWQVWQNPSATNWLSVSRNYRKLARAAVEAARASDPKAIVHLAEPGGVDLDFLNELNTNSISPLFDGVSVFPVSGWQPNNLANPEEFLRPYEVLRTSLQPPSDGKVRDYWVGGLSLPVAQSVEGAKANDAGKTSLSVYTPAAQAEYLVKATALALASGTEKVFWNSLRDTPAVATADGVAFGTGLLDAAGNPRPSYRAFQTLAKTIGDKPYAGQLSLDSNLIALLFDDGKSGTLVVWSPRGNGTLTVNPTGVGSQAPGSVFVGTRPDSLLLNASGQSLGQIGGAVKVGSSPLFITNVAGTSATSAKQRFTSGPLKLQDISTLPQAKQATAAFGEANEGTENGIYWRRYLNFGGEAQPYSGFGLVPGLRTSPQGDVFDLRSQRPFIYLDVADDFAYNTPGETFTLTVQIRRPQASGGVLGDGASGFRIEYDGVGGDKTTAWQQVEPGEGSAYYTFVLKDAQFANSNGYDLVINAGGSKSPITFNSVTLTRGEVKAAEIAATG